MNSTRFGMRNLKYYTTPAITSAIIGIILYFTVTFENQTDLWLARFGFIFLAGFYIMMFGQIKIDRIEDERQKEIEKARQRTEDRAFERRRQQRKEIAEFWANFDYSYEQPKPKQSPRGIRPGESVDDYAKYLKENTNSTIGYAYGGPK